MSAEEDEGSTPAESPSPAEGPSTPTNEGTGADDAEMKTSPFEPPTMEEINLSGDFSPRREGDDE